MFFLKVSYHGNLILRHELRSVIGNSKLSRDCPGSPFIVTGEHHDFFHSRFFELRNRFGAVFSNHIAKSNCSHHSLAVGNKKYGFSFRFKAGDFLLLFGA